MAPFAVTGGVLAFFGALLLCFSVEVCVRLRKNAKRVKDPEIDKLKNLHHIKHWMPPGEFADADVERRRVKVSWIGSQGSNEMSSTAAKVRGMDGELSLSSPRHLPPTRFIVVQCKHGVCQC